MSIIITGLEMPTERESFNLTIKYNGMVLDTETGIQVAEAYELSSHGRLIDIDALDIYRREEKAQEDIDKSPFSEYLEGLKDGLHEAAKCLSTAPTIIEAES